LGSFLFLTGQDVCAYAIQESTDLGATAVWTGGSRRTGLHERATTISHTPPGGQAKDFMRLKVTSN
jgi:hypothetical protein